MLFLTFLVLSNFAVYVGGCAALLPQQAKTKIAQGVTAYCMEPLATRLVLRAEVNTLTAPHLIKVTCQGDPPQ
jgi:hypothetical protein